MFSQADFRKILSGMKRNRYKDDLHSAMFYFKSGTIAYIAATFDGNFQVIIKDQDIQRDCDSLDEVLSVFSHDDLTNYDM